MVGFRIDFGDRAVELVKELDEKEKVMMTLTEWQKSEVEQNENEIKTSLWPG